MVVTDKLAQLTDNEKLRALYEKEDKINLFSLEGVNVNSILKYDKLVLDEPALSKLEHKLEFELTRYDFLESHNEPEHPLLDKFWQEIGGNWKDKKYNQGGYKSGHHKFYKDWPTF